MDDTDKQWDQIKRNGSKALTNLIVLTANKQCKSTQCFYLGLLTWPVSFIFLLAFFGFSLKWFWTYTTTITMVLPMFLGTTTMTGLPIQYSYRVCHYYLLLMTFPSSCLLQTHMFLYNLNSKPNLKRLKKESNPRVQVNTFDALEPEALKALEKLNLVSVGPLVPYAILDGRC